MNEVIEKFEKAIREGKIDLSTFEVLLNAEEKSILNVLKKKRLAMNVNEIREALIEDFLELARYYQSLNRVERDLSLHKNPFSGREILGSRIPLPQRDINEAKQEYNRLIKSKPKPLYWKGDFNDSYDRFLSLINRLRENGIGIDSLTSREKKIVAKLLRECGIANIPAYGTIEGILREFEASGIVLSRSDTRGKGKKLYAINPVLLKHE